MAKSPVVQMHNWFFGGQQWWCGPSIGNVQDRWAEYTEALEDATG